MKKRTLRLALCLALALGLMAAAPAAAAAWDEANSLQVTLPDTEAYKEDLAPAEGEEFPLVVDLYLVATPEDWEGYDAFYFTQAGLADPFQALTGFPNGAEAMEKMGADDWTKIAHEAGAIVMQPAAEGGEASLNPAATAAKTGCPVAVTEEKISAEGLKSGLYLVLAHGRGAEPKDYITTAKGEDGTSYAATTYSSENYVYTFQPMLVTLPEQVLSTENLFTGEWEHAVSATLKPDRVDRNGELVIVKGIDVYDRDEPATFVFHVTATKGTDAEGNPVTVYDNIFSLTFDSSTSTKQEIRVTDIPVGATVTVTEVYSGASYTVTGGDTRNAVIEANEEVGVTFENTHNPDRKQGHGVLNEFSFEDGGWSWEKVFPGTYPEGDRPPVTPEA